MSKKNFILIAIVLVLAVVYVAKFTRWLRPGTIRIAYTIRPVRAGGAGGALMFALGSERELTELKVVPLAARQASPPDPPLWHLVGDPASAPVDHFLYGQNIDGMNPAVAGAQPQPLQPGVTYRIYITAGPVKGERDFQTKSVTGQ